MQFAFFLNHAAWITGTVVYLSSALRRRRNVQVEPPSSQMGHNVTFAIALALIFFRRVQVGFLGWQLIPATVLDVYAGLGITLVGIIFATAARFELGANWNAIAAIRREHTLIRKGPYALVRHPIYSGFLLALIGTSVQMGTAGCFLGVLIAFACWSAKARIEESFLLSRFGQEYAVYQSQVGMLIPFTLNL